MSLSYQPLQPIKIVDPLTDVQSVSAYSVYEGGQQVSYKAYTSTSISNTSIQFSSPPPSSQVFVDRMQQAVIPVRLTFTGTAVTTNGAFVTPVSLLNAGFDAPRAFPLSSILDTLRVSINNDSVSINMSDVIHPLMRFGANDEVRAKEWSGTPNMPDQSMDYADLVGSDRNPLNQYQNGNYNDVLPRGAAQYTIVNNVAVVPVVGAGTACTAVVDLLITENLFLSPFYMFSAGGDKQAFYNVNSMDFDFNFQTSGMRIWSHAASAAVETSGVDTIKTNITAITMQFTGFTGPAFSYAQSQPTLLFKYISPSYLDKQRIGPSIPITYGYADVVRFPTTIGTLTYAQGAQPFQSNNIQLNQIPDRMYIFARPSKATLESRCDLTDTYLAIQNISVQFANASVLLSTATQQQLYQINLRNSYQGTYSEFTGQLQYGGGALPPKAASTRFSCGGGVLCLKFGQDVQLGADESAGLMGQYQVQVTVSLKNTNISTLWDAIPFELYIIAVNAGTFTITAQGNTIHQVGVLSKMDIMNAQRVPGLNAGNPDIRRINGGGFFDDIGEFAGKVNDFLKSSKIASVASEAIPVIGPYASKVIGNLGYGTGGCEFGQGVIGGQMLSKKQMRRSLLDR